MARHAPPSVATALERARRDLGGGPRAATATGLVVGDRAVEGVSAATGHFGRGSATSAAICAMASRRLGDIG